MSAPEQRPRSRYRSAAIIAAVISASCLLLVVGLAGVVVLARRDIIGEWQANDPGALRFSRIRPSLTRGLWIEFTTSSAWWPKGTRLYWYLRPWRGTMIDYPDPPPDPPNVPSLDADAVAEPPER